MNMLRSYYKYTVISMTGNAQWCCVISRNKIGKYSSTQFLKRIPANPPALGVKYIKKWFDNFGALLAAKNCCCCCLPDPFRGMGTWRKTMEPQKPGNSPGSGPEVVKRQRVAKE